MKLIASWKKIFVREKEKILSRPSSREYGVSELLYGNIIKTIRFISFRKCSKTGKCSRFYRFVQAIRGDVLYFTLKGLPSRQCDENSWFDVDLRNAYLVQSPEVLISLASVVTLYIAHQDWVALSPWIWCTHQFRLIGLLSTLSALSKCQETCTYHCENVEWLEQVVERSKSTIKSEMILIEFKYSSERMTG